MGTSVDFNEWVIRYITVATALALGKSRFSISEVLEINKYDKELLELATNIMFDYDGMDGSIESMKDLVGEIDAMVKAVLCNNSREYLEKLKG